MRMWLLGSGSRGNAIVLESGDTRVLVDAGFTASVLVDRMRTVEIAPESISSVIITHEHTDHVRGVRVLCERFGWSAHATFGTISASRELAQCKPSPFRAGDAVSLGDLDILTVKSSHDAAESVVLVATSRSTGARTGIAYDLGVVTQSVTDLMRDVDMLVLEANHDELMLHAGPYPASVRARISGRNGHLSNGRAAQLARDVAHRNLRQVVLAHISEKCNTQRTALTDVGAAMSRTKFSGRLSAAGQDRIAGPFEPGARCAVAVQLTLGI